MEQSFLELLESLGKEDQPIDRTRLAELSDLDREHLNQFGTTWRDLNPAARLSVLQALGLLADTQIELTFEAINRMALTDADSLVRVQAIENLWESEDPALVNPLLSALEDGESPQVRSAAAKALGTFVLLGETHDLPAEVTEAIKQGLLRANRDESSEAVKDRSLESLGYSSQLEVPELIESAFGSSSETRLEAALRAMSRSANSRWAEHVQSQLSHANPAVRQAAAQAVGEIEARGAASELVELIEDVDDRVRQAAIWSLGQLGGKLAEETLDRLLESAEDEAESTLIQDAIDNMDFVESTRALLRQELDQLEGSAD